ncbi:MAG: murein L,D-transpeptidase [Actinobacteria bacterium]|nr:murein L,D-transpeptidase [Actinomycetota bacterium]
MTRLRPRTAAVVVVGALGIVALVTGGSGADAQVLPPEPTTTTSTTAPPPPAEQPPPPPTMKRGDRSGDVENVQHRLKYLGYDPGAANGVFGRETEFAVFAFQKTQGVPVTGQVAPEMHRQMANAAPPPALAPNLGGDRVEVDLGRQLMTIYRGNAPVIITTISSGNNRRYCVRRRRCAYAVTPRGTFAIGRTARGWETSPLGRLYNSAYFYRGFALHGSLSVPLYPASHGCVRVPMHTAAWFQSQLYRGMPVFVGG